MKTSGRRARGTGSIVQRGTWNFLIGWQGPRDALGKRKKLWEAIRGSRDQAERELRRRIKQVVALEEFRQFVISTDHWRSLFGQRVANVLRGLEMGPEDLAPMIDQIPWDVWLWLREGRLPPDEVVKRVEQALQLQPGSLSISPEVRKWHREIPTRSRAFARIRDVGENPSSPFAGAVASLMFDRRMLVIPLAAATNLSRSMLTKYLHNGVVPDDLGITLRLEDAFHVPRCTLAQHVPPDARGRRMAEGKLREARIRFGEEFESKTDYPSRGVEWIWRNTAEHAMCISEVAIELDMWIENVTPWYSGVTLPSKRMARRLELLFRTVGLESLIADERAEGNSARQRWKRQVATRKKNYTATALKRKYDRGEFTRNGPWSETRKLGPPAHKGRRMKIRGRVHLVFAGFVAAYEKQQSYIAFCYRCNIALFRPNSSRPLSGHHYHGSCRFGNVGNDPKLAANVRFGRGRWPSGRSIVYVIEHEI